MAQLSMLYHATHIQQLSHQQNSLNQVPNTALHLLIFKKKRGGKSQSFAILAISHIYFINQQLQGGDDHPAGGLALGEITTQYKRKAKCLALKNHIGTGQACARGGLIVTPLNYAISQETYHSNPSNSSNSSNIPFSLNSTEVKEYKLIITLYHFRTNYESKFINAQPTAP